ncbi:DUF3117 domain-containing protein [Pseudonocardia hydrocarbonoxydans]|uniref:Uncharacterized protein n=1 Tax=Pseudonocardia hydrocarbonoxydans TaxID=76726 RepID=A0A4Y3WX08_9PSEU|nr:DUF3117 domain-containing protein [Pseudonocardia hydrocarbonoxydans]GEC22801.1 hypothetical protein PHY01_50840 [Pseudonocardia hydrocarbonoxydans]
MITNRQARRAMARFAPRAPRGPFGPAVTTRGGLVSLRVPRLDGPPVALDLPPDVADALADELRQAAAQARGGDAA